MTVSIIIAVKTWQKNLEECVSKCLELDYPDFEIIILPDEEETVPSGAILKKGNASVRVIPTGPVSPPEKRDIGLKHANGDILAFLDDDAWPEKDWIKKAVENFKDEGIAAVGGPAITCPNDNLRQKAGK